MSFKYLNFSSLKKKAQAEEIWFKDKPRIVIIGGGTSALGTAMELRAQGLSCIMLEQRTTHGGIWSQEKHPASYSGLIQNTAPALTRFEEAPLLPPQTGLHVSREEYADYIDNYVERY